MRERFDRIDYMNERRAQMPAAGGKTYRRERNPVDDRAAYAGLDPHEQTMLQVGAVFAEFRSWSRNLPPITFEPETEIPF